MRISPIKPQNQIFVKKNGHSEKLKIIKRAKVRKKEVKKIWNKDGIRH